MVNHRSQKRNWNVGSRFLNREGSQLEEKHKMMQKYFRQRRFNENLQSLGQSIRITHYVVLPAGAFTVFYHHRITRTNSKQETGKMFLYFL